MLGSLQLKGPIYWLHVHPTELPSKASCGLWCRKRFQTSCVPAAYPGFQRLNHWRNPAPSSGTDRNWGNVCARKWFGNRAVRDLSRAKLIQEQNFQILRSCAWRTPCWTTPVLPLRRSVPCARVVIFEPSSCTASKRICCLWPQIC
jgi:hypothetical protein